jgi:predicted metal-binding protein
MRYGILVILLVHLAAARREQQGDFTNKTLESDEEAIKNGYVFHNAFAFGRCYHCFLGMRQGYVGTTELPTKSFVSKK